MVALQTVGLVLLVHLNGDIVANSPGILEIFPWPLICRDLIVGNFLLANPAMIYILITDQSKITPPSCCLVITDPLPHPQSPSLLCQLFSVLNTLYHPSFSIALIPRGSYGEGNAVQGLHTDGTGEAVGVEGAAQGAQDLPKILR